MDNVDNVDNVDNIDQIDQMDQIDKNKYDKMFRRACNVCWCMLFDPLNPAHVEVWRTAVVMADRTLFSESRKKKSTPTHTSFLLTTASSCVVASKFWDDLDPISHSNAACAARARLDDVAKQEVVVLTTCKWSVPRRETGVIEPVAYGGANDEVFHMRWDDVVGERVWVHGR